MDTILPAFGNRKTPGLSADAIICQIKNIAELCGPDWVNFEPADLEDIARALRFAADFLECEVARRTNRFACYDAFHYPEGAA
jgi:hypothetical protein